MAKKQNISKLAEKIESKTLSTWMSRGGALALRDDVLKRHHTHEEIGAYSDFASLYEPNPKEDSDEMGALVVSKDSVLAKHEGDSLHQVREAAGLNVLQEELVEWVRGSLSLEEGLKKTISFLNKRAKRKIQKLGLRKVETLEDVGKVIPEITSAEIAWISAVKGFPSVYLDDSLGVPTIMDFNVDGIEFGYNGFDSVDLQSGSPLDGLQAAGFTNARQDVEFCEYKGKFARAFRTLAFLALTDSFVYQRIYEDHKHNALIHGDGRIKKAILRADPSRFNLSPENLEERLLQDLPLSAEDRTHLQEEVGKRLSTKVVYDLGRDEACSERDLVTLCGILSDVPQVLLQQDLFKGYVLPFGKGLRILDSSGNQIDYVGYDSYLEIRAEESLVDETTSISRNNLLANAIFSSFASDLEARVTRNVELPADEVRDDFRVKYGIIIPTRATKEFKQETSSFVHFAGGFSGVSKVLYEYSLKVGLKQARSLFGSLEKLPKNLVPEIRTVTAVSGMGNLDEMLMGGAMTVGSYISGLKQIKLNLPRGVSFLDLSAVDNQIYDDTMIHELGHGIWRQNLPEFFRAEWSKISGADKDSMDDEDKRGFIFDFDRFIAAYTYDPLIAEVNPEMLSQKLRIEEDFCQHFSAYVNHGPEFRERAQGNQRLGVKYEFFKDLFSAMVGEGEVIEYYDPCFISLNDIESRRTEMIRRNINEIVGLSNLQARTKEASSRRFRELVVPSLEVINGEGGDPELHNHIYNRKDPRHTYLLREVQSLLPVGNDVKSIDPKRLQILMAENLNKAAGYVVRQVNGTLEKAQAREYLGEIKEMLDGGFQGHHSIFE